MSKYKNFPTRRPPLRNTDMNDLEIRKNIPETDPDESEESADETEKNSNPTDNELEESDPLWLSNEVIIASTPNRYDKIDGNEENISTSPPTYSYMYIPFILVICAIAVTGCYFANQTDKEPDVRLKDIRTEFLRQKDDLWYAFEAGLADVKQFHRPSTFILLYTDESHPILRKLLEKISRWACCNLSECTETPLILTSNQLNASVYLNDYGRVITDYKAALELKRVLIVLDIQEVAGVVAQAFHTICDQYTPLVEKLLIIFTMKVDDFPENSFNYVENELRKSWYNIKTDIFAALFTRISNMILEIIPE